MDLEKLKYPIGRYQFEDNFNKSSIKNWIKEIENFPKKLKTAINDLTEEQLDTNYRPGGWTVRQVIHHIADSHMNAYIRFKLALTEDKPVIKPYKEKLWAELPDNQITNIAVTVNLIEALHIKLVDLLKQLDDEKFNKEFIHPDSGTKTIKDTIGLYAWHGNHHLAHINLVKI
jgi:uncharacterized damage-inducible protein DinB